jgi:DNA-binding MarR family transcriptional regulator
MDTKPDDATVDLWVALTRAQRRALATVEARLKAAELPPLAWYDALWELERAGECGLRPFELERALLFEQYNLSRLADRLEQAGHIERKQCPGDRRGQMLAITQQGRDLRRRMWDVYGPAIRDAMGDEVGPQEARTLASLLGKLG